MYRQAPHTHWEDEGLDVGDSRASVLGKSGETPCTLGLPGLGLQLPEETPGWLSLGYMQDQEGPRVSSLPLTDQNSVHTFFTSPVISSLKLMYFNIP